jgi:hypothetical protein
VLGSTGSIGTQTLDIMAEFPDKFKLVALSAGSNVDLLAKQVRRSSASSSAATSRETAAAPLDISPRARGSLLAAPSSGRPSSSSPPASPLGPLQPSHLHAHARTSSLQRRPAARPLPPAQAAQQQARSS